MSMLNNPRPTVAARDDVRSAVALGDETLALLKPGMKPEAVMYELVKRGALDEGLRFWMHAIPRHTAVWWACVCVRLAQPKLPPLSQRCLTLVSAWAHTPNTANAEAAALAATRTAADDPAGMVGLVPQIIEASKSVSNLGSAWSRMLMTAMHLAITRSAEKPSEVMQKFLFVGLDIASGNHPGPQAAS